MEKINDETDVAISVEGETYIDVAKRVAESKHKWYLSNIWGLDGKKIPTIKRYDIGRVENECNKKAFVIKI